MHMAVADLQHCTTIMEAARHLTLYCTPLRTLLDGYHCQTLIRSPAAYLACVVLRQQSGPAAGTIPAKLCNAVTIQHKEWPADGIAWP
jgi:hypothetical protein